MNQWLRTLNYSPTYRKRYVDAYAQMLESSRDRYNVLAVTAVFNASGGNPNPVRWTNAFCSTVLKKINRRIGRGSTEQIVSSDHCIYEYGISSRFDAPKDRRMPHHIHGFLLIPNEKADRVWLPDECRLHPRLEKDFASSHVLSSVKVEAVAVGDCGKWLSYCVKGKAILDHI